MSLKQESSDGEYVDDKLAEYLGNEQAEQIFSEFGGSGKSGRDGIKFLEKWFPKEENWQGKTDITVYQARQLALFRNLCKAFPEINELEPFIESALTDYEQYLTSVEGSAREQHTDILMSMFGGGSSDSEEARNWAISALAAKGDDNDD